VGKMKILMLLSKEFKNDYRAYREAKVLAEEDNEVTIIMWDRLGEGPSEEKVDKILVIRVCNDYLMRKLPHDLFRNPLWWREAYKRAIELCRDEKFDVIHCHDLDTLPIGVRLKKARGVKLVYDVHEVFGYMIMRNMPKLISKISFYMEKKLIKSVDHVITVSKPVKRYLEGITNKPVTIVRNCKDLIIKEYTPPKNELFTISYIGILHKNRMFPELVDIVGKIDGIRFLIAGKKENLYKEVEKRCEKYENVEFLGTIPIEEVIPKTLESNVVISILDPNDPNCRIALLNKQFEAMVCGRPIIVTKGTYAGKMTEKLKCGLAVEYNEDAVKKAIIKLREDPKLCEELGRNALRAAIEKYNWENEKKKLLKIYENM
jgi:glycosyltransferase involved in cell wall biosynthesis